MPRPSSFVPHSWYLRTQQLLDTNLQQRINADWKKTYPILLQAVSKTKGKIFTNEVLEDPLAVAVLIESGRDPSEKSNQAIRKASQEGYTEVVRLLLADPRVDPTMEDRYGYNPIELASENGHAGVVRTLLTDPRVDPSYHNNFSLRYAAIMGHTEVIRLLLADSRVDPMVRDGEIIVESFNNRRIEVVELLLTDSRVSQEVRDNYTILIAYKRGTPEVVNQILSDPNFDPTTRNNELFRLACRDGYTELVKLLLTNPRLNIDATIQAAAVQATIQGHTEVVRLLLANPRTDTSLVSLEYLLDRALRNEHPEVMKLILAQPSLDLQAIEFGIMRNIIEYPGIIDTSIVKSSDVRTSLSYTLFEKNHYYIFLRELLFKKADLEYYFRWLLDQCTRHADALEYRRVISEAAESYKNTGKVVHTSPIFTAYSGFLLLAKSRNKKAILDLLRKEGASQQGLWMAEQLLDAFLKNKS